MVLKTFDNLKQLERLLALFRRFSIAFRGLWNFHNDPKGFWQVETVLGSLRQL